MSVIHGSASWPGVIGVESCVYTCSHGISPGVAVLRMQPQAAVFAMYGDLAITDGFRTVVIPACRVNSVKVDQGDGGTCWNLEIVDRRWRWRSLGGISGCYNQLDPKGKLIPWTIRSPTELAGLCLEAMGEVGYSVDMPDGLAYPGPSGTRRPTINTTGVNTPVDWIAVPPAQQLQSIAEQFGRRIVYNLQTDTVLVTRAGFGGPLPLSGASIHKQGPSLKNPETPDSVGVVGAPTRFQARIALEAVGEEWDGQYVPINSLSYAPQSPAGVGSKQVNNITIANPALGATWKIIFDSDTLAVNCQTAVVATELGSIANAINLSAAPGPQKVTAAVVGTTVVVTGKTAGVSFALSVEFSPPMLAPPQYISQLCVQLAVAPADGGGGSWDKCGPPTFSDVRATDQLTYFEAVRLAQKSVFKCYRVKGTNPFTQRAPVFIPGYGKVRRKQQIFLTDTQVDQVVPTPKVRDRADATGLPFTEDFYNGYSRDKPAAIYGSTFIGHNGGVWYKNLKATENTLPGSRVFVPIASIDALKQLVTLTDYVYFFLDNNYKEPFLAIQTAVNIRDAVTNQFECYTKIVPVPGQAAGTNPQIARKTDVQVDVTSTYGQFNQLLAFGLENRDAISRANYYLDGMILPYLPSTSQTLQYNGIVPIACDGAIGQVTWDVGGSGASTTASLNTEHEVNVPPYPARRRREYLPAIKNDRVNFRDDPR